MRQPASASMPRPPAPIPTPSQGGYAAPAVWTAVPFLAALALALSGCGDNRVAGTSSGVDNPQLTVAFQDSTGAALRVTGDLNVYGLDQNPTVSPEPLWTIKLYDNAIVNLPASDLSRFNAAAASKSAAAAKVSAGSSTSLPAQVNGNTIAFNLQLKTEDRKGQFAFGLVYDSSARTFTQTGSAKVTRLEMKARPLVRFEARIARDSLGGSLNRVFIPGTPFQATLVDSVFAFEDLPEGAFPLRFLTADGHVFAVKETLDTHGPRVFTPGKDPVSTVDPIHNPGSDSLTVIDAGPDREVFMDAPTFLDAHVPGVDPKNPRLAIVWRQLERDGDTALAGDTILNPTLLHSEIRFFGEGAYTFQVTATLGLQTRSDTLVLSVKKIPPPPRPRLIQPRPNDTLLSGRPFPITWEMPVRGPVTVRASANNGEKWIVLAEHLDVKGGPAIFNWTPSAEFGLTVRGLVQVRLDADTTQAAVSEGMFTVTH